MKHIFITSTSCWKLFMNFHWIFVFLVLPLSAVAHSRSILFSITFWFIKDLETLRHCLINKTLLRGEEAVSNIHKICCTWRTQLESVNAQILIRIVPVWMCVWCVWSNNDDARIIAYSIIQWQLSAVPIQKCQWAIKCVMSCSYRRIHLLHRLLYTVYHI